MTNTRATAHWAGRLAEIAAAERVPGAVLGIWADGEQTLAAHGVLSTATRVPVTPDAVFQIGSITKPWTATMIMQLIEEGRLSLDTTVASVLPGVRLGAPDISGVVTIRHLLTHTSGLDGDIFTDTGRGGDCVARYVAELANASQGHPVGAAYSYCNSGFVLLGRIIEVLDGRQWDESLRQRLIEPLGLAATVTLPEEAIMHRAAVGHREHPHEDDPVSIWGLARALGPAGLITASAGDVLTFARLHLDDGLAASGTRVLSQASAVLMRQQAVKLPSLGSKADAVGLTWRLDEWGGRGVFGHDGSTVGQTAYLRIDARAKVAVCLLTNAADSQILYQRLFGEVFTDLCGVTPPPDPAPVTGGVATDVARHAGRYERSSWRIDISPRDGGLRALSVTTGELGAVTQSEPEEDDLYPADSSGDNFVCRSHETAPWVAMSFRALDDGTPYLYAGGRITLRVS